MSMAVLLGLASALFYGVTDYLVRVAGRAVGLWRIMFYSELVSLLLLSGWGGVTHMSAPAPFSSHPWAWCAAIGSAVVLLAAATLLTQGLIKGSLAVVAPVAASYGAVTTALSVAAGEHLSVRTLVGLTLTVGGVSLVSVPPNASRQFRDHLHSSGLAWGAGAAACYGVGFWLQGEFAVPTLGPLIPVWLSYAVGVLLLLALARTIRLSLTPPRQGALMPVLASGVFGVLAYVALAVGLTTGRVAVVVVLSTLASAVTVLLSRMFEKAHVAKHQWLAIAVIIVGLGLIKI